AADAGCADRGHPPVGDPDGDRAAGPGRCGNPAVTARRAARLLRAAASAALLAALIAGLPVALYKLGGNPFPRHLPSWHQATAALGRRDDGTLFLATVRD